MYVVVMCLLMWFCLMFAVTSLTKLDTRVVHEMKLRASPTDSITAKCFMALVRTVALNCIQCISSHQAQFKKKNIMDLRTRIARGRLAASERARVVSRSEGVSESMYGAERVTAKVTPIRT